MISFDKLWITMKEKNISQYKLIKEYKISTGQLDRLRKNGNVNTYTLDQLCKILNCQLNDIAEYIVGNMKDDDKKTFISFPIYNLLRINLPYINFKN